MEDELFFVYLFSESSIKLFNTETEEIFSYYPSNTTYDEILKQQLKP